GIGTGGVLADLRLVHRYIQACRVGQVEDVELILQAQPFGWLEALADGKIQPLLRGLAEEVALSRGGKGGLVDVGGIVTGGGGNAVRSGGEIVDGDLGGVDGRDESAAGAAHLSGVTCHGPLGGG